MQTSFHSNYLSLLDLHFESSCTFTAASVKGMIHILLGLDLLKPHKLQLYIIFWPGCNNNISFYSNSLSLLDLDLDSSL